MVFTEKSCLLILNHIHVINGGDNKHYPLIHDVDKNNIIIHKTSTLRMARSAVSLYQNGIIKFGGYDEDAKKRLDTFFMSDTMIDSEVNNNIDFYIKQGYQSSMPFINAIIIVWSCVV